ncbi:hypothetical protein LguiB_020993 [Lonicera macranthoides]
MYVELVHTLTTPFSKNSLKTFKRSSFITSQPFLKASKVKPSGPGDFSPS